MDALFLYRKAGEEVIHSHEGTCLDGLTGSGFALGTFDGRMYTIQPERSLDLAKLNETLRFLSRKETGMYYLPYRSTTREAYDRGFGVIMDNLEADEKTVYSRIVTDNRPLDALESFMSLCAAYPSAFVFCVSTPDTGTWIGASPEILLRGDGKGCFRTMALAGTRPAGTSGEWDSKNIEEHRIVSDYIGDILNAHCLDYTASELQTRNAGNIEHLCREFVITGLRVSDTASFREFLSDLYPTPALCGYPKEKARRTVEDTEGHPRGLYGGFVGPVDGASTDLNVVVRAARFTPDRVVMFAGGGITPASDAADEWTEAERKSLSVMRHLRFTGDAGNDRTIELTE